MVPTLRDGRVTFSHRADTPGWSQNLQDWRNILRETLDIGPVRDYFDHGSTALASPARRTIGIRRAARSRLTMEVTMEGVDPPAAPSPRQVSDVVQPQSDQRSRTDAGAQGQEAPDQHALQPARHDATGILRAQLRETVDRYPERDHLEPNLSAALVWMETDVIGRPALRPGTPDEHLGERNVILVELFQAVRRMRQNGPSDNQRWSSVFVPLIWCSVDDRDRELLFRVMDCIPMGREAAALIAAWWGEAMATSVTDAANWLEGIGQMRRQPGPLRPYQYIHAEVQEEFSFGRMRPTRCTGRSTTRRHIISPLRSRGFLWQKRNGRPAAAGPPSSLPSACLPRRWDKDRLGSDGTQKARPGTEAPRPHRPRGNLYWSICGTNSGRTRGTAPG